MYLLRSASCTVAVTPALLSTFFFFSSRRRHTRCLSDWSSDVCSSDLHFVRLRRAHAALHAGAALGAPLARSPPAAALGPAPAVAPGRRRLAAAAAAVLAPHGQLEVPFGAEVVRPQQQRFAVCPLGVGETRVPGRAVG